jgi:hypothetical protein
MDQRWVELAQTLRELGMWRDLPETVAAEAERKVANGGFPFRLFDDQENVRWFFVDGENMAEYGVGSELQSLAPALRALGVELRIERLSPPAGGPDKVDYVVGINGRRCIVWTPEEWASDNTWEIATVRPLAVINDLLAEAGAVPRLFTLYAGVNEGVVWLLDPRIVAAVTDKGLLPERETPVLATHI